MIEPAGRTASSGVVGLTSVDLGVRNIAEAAACYRELGFHDRGDGLLRGPGGALRLVERPNGGPAGWRDDDLQRGVRHIGFTARDITSMAARLVAAGATLISPPTAVVGGVVICFLLDPSGNRFELQAGSLDYDETVSPADADAGARAIAQQGEARFDHVGMTVADLNATIAWYGRLGARVIGTIRHNDDRGFRMTYLTAGEAVLEVFDFQVPTEPFAPGPDSLGVLATGWAPFGAASDQSTPGAGTSQAGSGAGISSRRDPDGVEVRLPADLNMEAI